MANTRFFILWYQILGHNAPDSVHAIFATLVPGFSSPIPEHPGLAALWNNHSSSINLHEHLLSKSHVNNINNIIYTKMIIIFCLGPVGTVETNLLYAPQMGEKQPEDVVKYYLESLLELMVNQVIIINVFIINLVYNKVFRKIINYIT